ncbi:MAG: membrane integrity-associated transporter subunit PqiC [Alphaproteobacteria bacterium]|nr:membrane integrity-associated transporter subunit PqiC [Alphaproteobacteria bacterium]MDE2163715.1 membrane integrity-associated transporter subunit PqiC [Alphaproteobacteria bacterium]MDE2500841.1 membrane integrity-associated transporter subunit PqiC [Alphaproteobacteria bacterium]
MTTTSTTPTRATASMMRVSRRLLLAGAGLVLAGCTASDLLGTPAQPKLYVLRPRPAAAPGPNVSWALSILTPDAAAGLDSDRIAIFRPPATLDYYADAAWPDQLPVLLQSAVLQAFEASGRIAKVAPDSDAPHADYVLATDLRDFEARYDQPDGIPTAVVRIQARLLNAVTRDVVDNFDASEEVPAAQNSVDAAVEALDTALGRALAQIVAWALRAPPPAK